MDKEPRGPWKHPPAINKTRIKLKTRNEKSNPKPPMSKANIQVCATSVQHTRIWLRLGDFNDIKHLQSFWLPARETIQKARPPHNPWCSCNRDNDLFHVPPGIRKAKNPIKSRPIDPKYIKEGTCTHCNNYVTKYSSIDIAWQDTQMYLSDHLCLWLETNVFIVHSVEWDMRIS